MHSVLILVLYLIIIIILHKVTVLSLLQTVVLLEQFSCYMYNYIFFCLFVFSCCHTPSLN